jgi:hypothetical protein
MVGAPVTPQRRPLPPRDVSVRLVPLSQREAKAAVTRWHRHNAAPVGDLFRVGVADGDTLVAVGVAGRPVARHFDDGDTVEVTRVACSGQHKNTASMLYGALARAAFALGYRRVITYTQANEPGTSLKAAGWRVIASRPPRNGWSTVSRPRDDARYLTTQRTLWEATP